MIKNPLTNKKNIFTNQKEVHSKIKSDSIVKDFLSELQIEGESIHCK